MSRIMLLAAVVTFVPASAAAECPESERAALEAFDRAWGEANRRGDRAHLENVYADDFAGHALFGVTDRTTAIAATLRNFELTRANPARVVEDSYFITCNPNTATITHRVIATTTQTGVERSVHSRSVHFLERRGGRWQVVSSTNHLLDDVGVLVYLQADWNRAARNRDIAWFERNLADDFTAVHGVDGMLRTKADFIEQRRADRSDVTAELSEVSVRIHGDAAVVTGVNRFRGRDAQGQPVDRRARFTDTFVKRDGRWVGVASQGTTIP